MSLFSVSKFLGRSRARANKRVPSVASLSSLTTDKGTSKNLAAPTVSNVAVVDARPTTNPAVPKPESIPEILSDKESSYATPLAENVRKSAEVQDGGKEELVEEHGYTVVLQPEAKTPDIEWTQLDLGSHPQEESAEARTMDDAHAMTERDVHHNVKDYEEELRATSEERARAEEHILDVENNLKIAYDELNIKSDVIESLQTRIKRMEAEVEELEKEKEEIQDAAVRARKEASEEVQRMKGIIATERHETEERVGGLLREIDELNAKVEAKDDQIIRLEASLADGRDEAGAVSDRNRDLEARLIRYEEDVAEDKDRVAEKENHIATLETSNENMLSQLVDLQNSLNAMERQNRMLVDQLRQQASEFQAGKGLNRPSSALSARLGRGTGAGPSATRLDIAVRALKMLNEEIYQTAASMTDQLECIAKRFVVKDDGRLALAEYLKSMLATELVKSLEIEASYTADDYNTFFIQTAFQGCLIACCMRIITSWYPVEWEYGNFLVALYERIRGTDGAEKALQWRKTARKNCVPPTNMNGKLVALLAEQIHAVLAVCGWSKQSEAEELVERFKPKLSEIATLAMRLNNSTAAGVAGDLECTLVEPGMTFDSEQMANDDAFLRTDKRRSNRDLPPDEQVICTVGLGLKWAKDVDVEADRILLKPKVVLYSALKIELRMVMISNFIGIAFVLRDENQKVRHELLQLTRHGHLQDKPLCDDESQIRKFPEHDASDRTIAEDVQQGAPRVMRSAFLLKSYGMIETCWTQRKRHAPALGQIVPRLQVMCGTMAPLTTD